VPVLDISQQEKNAREVFRKFLWDNEMMFFSNNEVLIRVGLQKEDEVGFCCVARNPGQGAEGVVIFRKKDTEVRINVVKKGLELKYPHHEERE